MKHWLVVLLSVFLWGGWACAQSTPLLVPVDATGWSRLEALNPESEISVSSDHHHSVRCTDVSVSTEGLSCALDSRWFGRHTFDFPRAEVRSIRLRHTHRDLWIGIGAASTLGFVGGVQSPGGGKVGAQIANGVLYGAIVGTASAILIYPTVQLLPGQTIYRRPRPQPQPSTINQDNAKTGVRP